MEIYEYTGEEVRKLAFSSIKEHRGSWARLGFSLAEIRDNEYWKDWGYNSFNKYCVEELNVTIMTAKSMIEAYYYIKINKPDLLSQISKGNFDGIPDYHTISNLSKARSSDEIGSEKAEELTNKLFEEPEKSKDVAKELKGIMSTEEVVADVNKEIKEVKKLSKRLNSKVQIATAFSDEIKELAEKLYDMVDRVGSLDV